MKLGIDLHTHFFSLSSMNPLDASLLTMVCRGSDIQMLPDGILLFLLSVFDLVNIMLLFEAYRFISVPKNLALSFLALVIRVFSSESVNLSSRRNSFRLVFSSKAVLLFPHIPIIQSSAYLTYLKTGWAFGFGMVEFICLCSLTTFLISSLIL